VLACAPDDASANASGDMASVPAATAVPVLATPPAVPAPDTLALVAPASGDPALATPMVVTPAPELLEPPLPAPVAVSELPVLFGGVATDSPDEVPEDAVVATESPDEVPEDSPRHVPRRQRRPRATRSMGAERGHGTASLPCGHYRTGVPK
jgi:hypothetical protein